MMSSCFLRFEPSHNFSLEILRMMHDCMVGMLGDEQRAKESTMLAGGNSRTLKQVKSSVLNELNRFFYKIERKTSGYALHVHFSK